MLVSSRAIVLHVTKYNDASIIVHTLTEAAGSVSFLVRISRSPRAAVQHSLFRPLAILEISWDNHGVHDLRRPRSARTAIPLASIPYDPHKSAMAFFLADFLHHALRVETDSAPLFAYVTNSLRWLDANDRSFSNFHIVFLLRLAQFLGVTPNFDTYTRGCYFDLRSASFVALRPDHADYVSPTDAARLKQIVRINYGTMHLFHFSGRERSELLEHIVTYYRLHLPAFPALKSLDVLRELFDADR